MLGLQLCRKVVQYPDSIDAWSSDVCLCKNAHWLLRCIRKYIIYTRPAGNFPTSFIDAFYGLWRLHTEETSTTGTTIIRRDCVTSILLRISFRSNNILTDLTNRSAPLLPFSGTQNLSFVFSFFSFFIILSFYCFLASQRTLSKNPQLKFL